MSWKLKDFILGRSQQSKNGRDKEDIKSSCEKEKGAPGPLGYLSLLARKDEHKVGIAYAVLYFPKLFCIRLYYSLSYWQCYW